MSNCVICDETFNKSAHSLVTCLYCSFDACRSCCETYMLEQPIAKCMNTACGKEWTRKFIVSQFTKSFVNGAWKKHVEKVLFDKETALLPNTQAVVEREIHKEKLTVEMDECAKLIKELEKRRRNLKIQANMGFDPANSERKTFVRACPVDNCRGFLSSQWKCGLCETYTCPDCHAVKGKGRNIEHVCNADEVATAQLLNTDTKSCPNCASNIFKINGCDQMWCTQCHVAFSWKTGQVETRIHNPHYYEWQRLNGNAVPRNPNDIICGREVNHRLYVSMYNTLLSKLKKSNIVKHDDMNQQYVSIYNTLCNTILSIAHLREVQMPTYAVVNNVDKHLALRVSYMRNQIDKETFQKRIQRDNKRYEQKREICEILEMLCNTVTDIMYRAQNDIGRIPVVMSELELRLDLFDELKKTLGEIDSIVIYVNDCLAEISTTYNSKAKKISFSRIQDGAYTQVLQ